MKKNLLALILLPALVLTSCKDSAPDLDPNVDQTQGDNFAIPDWTDASHSNKVDPNYSIVFAQDAVNTLDIAISKEDWAKIKADMKTRTGNDFGAGGTMPGGGAPPAGGGGGGNPPGGGAVDLVSGDPIYVPASLKYKGKSWYRVGFRLKGNSSLSNAWRSGNFKLPFKLQFDEYEDQYPQINDQRFYGFKEFSMSPGFMDQSLIREKVTPEIFRMAGIPAPQTAFYRVNIDFGDGPKYCGVYTMVEVIDDSMVKTQYGEKKGNIYKPEGAGATFAENAFNQAHFEKKTNEDKADWSDITAIFTALHSKDRTTNPAQWRANLEKVFNADQFLKWLAVNTTLQNWDTYGVMTHNYYLYNSPTQRMVWIPWDNNEALKSQNRALSLAMSEVKSSWPLIRYLLDDATYLAAYKSHMRAFNDNVFTPQRMNELYERNHGLISQYASTEQKGYTYLTSSATFSSELSVLKQHVVGRNQAVKDFLK